MPLQLNISNSLFSLAGQLCDELKNAPENVFQPQYIVTQTEGMNNWLKMQIAENNDIAANFVFVSPNEIIQKIYYLLGGLYPNILSAENSSWLLYTILGEPEFIERFNFVSSYYTHGGQDKDLKRMGLAEKTADLFDQYQIYRPGWIESWNEGKPVPELGEEWQQYLWSRAKKIVKERLPDKTVIGKFIREALTISENQEKLKARIPVLHLFGLSIITDYHLDLLYEIGNYSEIHFHLVNPAPEVYWFEDKTEKLMAWMIARGFRDATDTSQGNVLLSSWGRVIQDTFLMLFKNEELINNSKEIMLEAPPADTLLHKIQNDIFRAAANPERNKINQEDPGDGSIMISSCFTIVREVEVLYNYLVHLIDQKKESLSPRDIVVMVTDIDAYAPFIKAVFKNAPYEFRFTIADESFANSDTMVSALGALLKINRLNFKAEEVLQLLDSAFIRNRFGLQNLDRLRKMVDAANIRFGIEGKKEDDTRFVSWEYGIKRIIYGICIGGGEEYIDPDNESLFPLDLIEGSDSLEAIRFCHFISILIDSINERMEARTIAQWVDYTERLIANMLYQPEEQIEEDYILLQSQLTNFNIAGEFLEEEISFEIFTHSLLKTISTGSRSGSFAGGGITFCSLIPMRSIPFRVVALLGLNNDKFPRKETAASFNLIEQGQRVRGDRNVKENDKHLFLDTLLSAKDYLYLSYLGQSAKDNTSIPPSVMVDELVDYIEANASSPELVRATLLTKHPLHGFSRKSAKSYPNYLEAKAKSVAIEFNTSAPDDVIDFSTIDLRDLVAFYKHPIKFYYNKVLDINYREQTVLLSDTEVFELNNLEEWSLKQTLLKIEPDAISAMMDREVKTGKLPLRNMAPVTVKQTEVDMKKQLDLFRETVGEELETRIDIKLEIDGSVLQGKINGIYGDKMVFISFSKKETKYLIEAYIRYLVLAAAGEDHTLYFISKINQDIFKAGKIPKDLALQKLTKLIQLYKSGHQSVLAFDPGIPLNPLKIHEFNEAKLKSAMKELLHTEKFPSHDTYLLNEEEAGFFEEDDFLGKYKANVELLILPLIDFFPGYFEKKMKK
ncbi:MAG: exodeoxyribonuclease V subunit gamma [Chitinophagaceae bacterium]